MSLYYILNLFHKIGVVLSEVLGSQQVAKSVSNDGGVSLASG